MSQRETGGAQRRKGEDAAEKADVQEAAEGQSDLQERQEQLGEDVDAILDEIDEVLESNAEEFVRSFVQKGGQ